MNRPDCAGWYEADPECDGDSESPECKYRSRCLVLAELAGGLGNRSPSAVRAASSNHDESALERLVKRQQQMSRMKMRLVNVMRHGRDGEAVEVHPRPARFLHAFPIVDAIAERFARELKRPLVEEGEGLAVGDVYLRFLPGMKGRQVCLYDFTGVNIYGLWIARLNMSFRKPELSIKVNCDQYDAAFKHDPPNGVAFRQWKDVRPMISLVRVGAEHARDAGRWLANLRGAGLIGPTPKGKL